MFQSIQKKLLERYPLLWNLKIVQVVPIIIFVHFIHFLLGYTSSQETYNDYYWNTPEKAFFSGSVVLFSFMGSIIIFIIWLKGVFKNNPFKSYYPLQNGMLSKQFILIFLISFFNITYYFSFTQGYVTKIRSASLSKQEATVQKTIFNNAMRFIASGKEEYNFINRRAPYPFPLQQIASSNYASQNANEQLYKYSDANGNEIGIDRIKKYTGGYDYSYLNKSNSYDNITFKELNNPDKNTYIPDEATLRKNLTAFIDLCKQYNVQHNLEVNEWIKWINNPPYYPVTYFVCNAYTSQYTKVKDLENDALKFNPKGYYVDVNKLQSAIRQKIIAFNYTITLAHICIPFYIALGLALLIFTFRLNNKRVYLLSYIGSGIIAILIGIFTAIFTSSTIQSAVPLLLIYLIIIFGFLFFHFIFSNKNGRGILLNWFTWSATFVPTIVWAIIITTMKESYRISSSENYFITHADAFYFWSGIVYIIFYCSLILPLYKRWHAQPE
jgi:hypothetical protein